MQQLFKFDYNKFGAENQLYGDNGQFGLLLASTTVKINIDDKFGTKRDWAHFCRTKMVHYVRRFSRNWPIGLEDIELERIEKLIFDCLVEISDEEINSGNFEPLLSFVVSLRGLKLVCQLLNIDIVKETKTTIILKRFDFGSSRFNKNQISEISRMLWSCLNVINDSELRGNRKMLSKVITFLSEERKRLSIIQYSR